MRASNEGQHKQTFLRNANGGSSIVEVLVGFVMLSVILASLSGIISLSKNMIMRSTDLLQEEQVLGAEIYKTKVTEQAILQAGKLAYYPLGSTPTLGREKIDSEIAVYSLSGAQLLSGNAVGSELMDMKIYLLKK